MTENEKLLLYEALELRAEYDSRIKTFKDIVKTVDIRHKLAVTAV